MFNPQSLYFATSVPHNFAIFFTFSPFKSAHMKERIFNNWRTSVLGIILLVIAVVLLFMRIITLGEFLAFFPTILGLLYVRDTVFRLNPRR